VRKPRAAPSTVPIPHDAEDELHFDDFLFVDLALTIFKTRSGGQERPSSGHIPVKLAS
jgi:hypothetical protein